MKEGRKKLSRSVFLLTRLPDLHMGIVWVPDFSLVISGDICLKRANVRTMRNTLSYLLKRKLNTKGKIEFIRKVRKNVINTAMPDTLKNNTNTRRFGICK